jgi:hypothetical protein
VNPKRRRHPKDDHCGFCGCEITRKEAHELGDCCWICHRNREDRAAASFEHEEDEE